MMRFQEKMKTWQTFPGVFVMLILLASLSRSQAQTDPCQGVDCQKGQCVVNPSVFMGFECKCNKGWAKVAPMITFLGCFLPDCKLNYSCDGSPSAAPAPDIRSSPPVSLDNLNLCMLPNLCGNGDCVGVPSQGILQLPSYKCNCHPGNLNLFNQTTGPCLPSCNLEGSCEDLGIPIVSAPPPPPQAPGDEAPSPDTDEGFAPTPDPNAPSPDSDEAPTLDPNAGKRQIGSSAKALELAILVAILGWLSM